jgi:cytochrome c-type biogenesis protein
VENVIALLGLAFGMGMLATMNPCGFALLPTYLAYSAAGSSGAATSLPRRLGYGLRAGLALSFGFAGALTLAAVVVALGARSIAFALPWVSLLVGAGLLLAGAVMLAGRKIPIRLPMRGAALRSGPTEPATGVRDAFLFGVGYAIASLSCSFGLLIALISQAMTAASVVGVLAVFGAFALGATTLLLGLSIVAAAAGGVVTSALKRFGKLWVVLPRLTGVILVLAGAYLIMYWLPSVSGRGAENPVVLALGEFAANVAAWLAQNQLMVILLAGVITAAALGIVLLSRSGSRSEASESSDDDVDVAEQGGR